MRYLALLLVLPTLVLQAATTTSAGAVIVAGFEIDGDTPVNQGGLDWASTGTHVTDPVGNIDTTTFKGSKEFEHPNTWVTGVGLAPNQDDVSDVYTYSQVVGKDTWSYLGFRRFTTSGTTNYDVEYNQVENSTNNPFAPVRTVGDLMVRFEQDGSSAFKLTLAYKWTRVSSPSWGAGCIEVPGYNPRSGWCSVPVAGSGFVGATGEGGHFAEGAFNLSSFFGGTTCRGAFGTLNLRSFTGNSNQSSLKDYIDPVDINIPSNCGQLGIRKFDQFGNDAAGATFTITPNPIPGQVGTLTVVDGGINDVPQEADGTITINPASPGTYTVTETAPPTGAFLPLPDPKPSVQVTVGPNGVGSTGPASFVNQRIFQPPTIVNAPNYDVDYNWLVTKSVSDPTTVNVPEGTDATFDYEVRLKALDPTPADFSGFGGTVTLTNPNALDMVVTLSAQITGGSGCTVAGADDLDVSAAPGLQVNLDNGANVFTYTCPTAALPGGTTATATWDGARYPQAPAAPAPTYSRSDAKPFIIDQETDETTVVTDTFNSGTPEDLGTFDWDDVRGETNASTPPHTVVVKTYKRRIPGVPGKCTPYTNTARESADGTDDSETVTVCVKLNDLVVSKTADPSFSRVYEWSIAKSVKGDASQTVPEGTSASFEYDVVVTPSLAEDAAFRVSGVITVTNPNETAISGVSLVDELPDATCTVVKPAGALTIPKGESSFDYSCVLPDATEDTTGTNTATATWDAEKYLGTDGSATGTHSFDFADADRDVADETATVTDSQVNLDDEVPGGVVVHAVDGPRTFTYTKAFDGVPGACHSYDNTATVVADDTKESDSDTQKVEVCVEKPLEPEVSGSGDLARTYAWSIAKVADATQRTVDGSGNATFTYTVTASAGAAADSGWQVKGSVTITNPNTYAAGDITADVTAATTVGGGSVCTVTGGNDVEIPASGDGVGSVTLPIACTFSTQPAGSGALDVTATWDPAGVATAATVTDSTPIIFAVRSETNKTVQVVDDKTVAGQRVVLDPALTWAPGLVKTYTYSLAVAGGAAGSCRSHTNTATIDQPVGVDPTASAAVLACTPAAVVPVVVAPEVLPEQAFGKAGGSVKATCQGTVRSRLNNRSGVEVTYKLRVGNKVHKIVVKSLSKKRFTTTGKPRARVVLKAGGRTLDRVRIPGLCAAPEVLPDTGMRAAEARLGSITRRWRN